MDLKQPLAALETSQLVRRLEESEMAYLFKHALVQDTVYSSLLKNDRKRLHRLVAESLERTYPEALDENAERLAQHYGEAGDDAKAFEYSTRAGDADARLYANAEAILHYSNALEAAKHLEQKGAPQPPYVLQHLYTSRGRAYELTSQYAQAQDNYWELEQVAQQRGDSGMKLAALVARSTLYATFTPLHNPRQARQSAEEALQLARQQQDHAAEAKILWNLLLVALYGEGNGVLAVEYGEQALTIARALKLPEQTAYILNDLFYPYLSSRTLGEAQSSTAEAQDLWRKLGNQPMLVDSLANNSLLQVLSGDWQSALEYSEEAFRLAQQSNNYWGQAYALMYRGYVHFKRGEPATALDAMHESIRLGTLADFYPPLAVVRANMGWLYAQLGAFAEGIALGEQALEAARTRLPYFQSWPGGDLARCYFAAGQVEQGHRVIEKHLRAEQVAHSVLPMVVTAQRALAIADYLRSQQQYAEAFALLDKQRGELEQQGVRAYTPEILWNQARLELLQGNATEAEAVLRKARSFAQELGSRWDLFQIYTSLFDLATQRGEVNAANEWRALARTEIDYIAAHTPDTLRETFLNLPYVSQMANIVRTNSAIQQ